MSKEKTTILVYAEKMTPRLQWILREVLGRRLGLDHLLIDDREAYRHGHTPGITYAREAVGRRHELVIWPSGLLERRGTEPLTPSLAYDGEGHPLLFPAPAGYDLPLDIFSAAFYLLSRYEEYQPFTPDGMGRFPAAASMAYREGWLDEPVVDLWSSWLADRLVRQSDEISYRVPPLRFVATYDIDQAYAYRGKPWWRLLPGGLVHGDLGRRWAVWRGKKQDPYDTFERIRTTHALLRERPVFFFHVGRWGRYDKSLPAAGETMREVVRQVGRYGQVGLHPSVHAARDNRILVKELEQLEALRGDVVLMSRMHYLMMRFPDIPRALVAAGIRQDFSLTYPDEPGFRAGTCHPFQWYDLEREEETSLQLVPTTLMDGALFRKASSPGEITACLEHFRKKTEPYGGLLVTLWHNHTLSLEGRWAPLAQAYLDWVKEHFSKG